MTHGSKHTEPADRIVVIGAPRSGTTLLKRYLASNTGCVLTPYPRNVRDVLTWRGGSLPVWKRTSWIQPRELRHVTDAAERTVFVVLLRHPDECYESLLELNLTRQYRTHPWVPIESAERFVEWWLYVHESAVKILSGERFCWLTYDRLVADAVSERARILATVGICGDASQQYDTSRKDLEDEKCLATTAVRPNARRSSAQRSRSDTYERIVHAFAECATRRWSSNKCEHGVSE